MSDDSNTLIKAEQTIHELGLPIPKKPYNAAKPDLAWPENVADLSTVELAEHLTWWSAWSGYARYHLARAETNHEAFSTKYRIETQVKIMKSKGDHKTVTELKASVAQLPEMQRLEAQMLKAEAEKKLLKALLENYEGKYKTVSREVTRRSADFDEDSRH
jgi:hypothetical protein